jgi:hypothetical protein
MIHYKINKLNNLNSSIEITQQNYDFYFYLNSHNFSYIKIILYILIIIFIILI